MSDEHSPGNAPEPRRHVPLQLTDAEGRPVWVVHSSVGSSSDADPGFSIFLAQLPEVLLRHWRTVLAAVLVTATLGSLYLLLATPVYGVGAEILVERRASALDEFSRMSSGNAFLATQAEIIHSPTIVEPALAELDGPLFDDPEVVPLNAALSLLNVTPIRGTDVVSINFRSPKRAEGSAFVTSMIQAYRDFLYNVEFTAHNDALELLASREADLRREIAELREEHRDGLRENGTVGEDGNLQSLQRSILQLHAKSAAESTLERSALQRRLSGLRRALSTGDLDAVPSDTVDRALLQRVQEAKSLRSQLETQVSPRHPDRRRIEHEIELLEAQVASAIRSEIARLQHALATNRAEGERLAGILEGELEENSNNEIARLGQEELEVEIAQLTEIHDQAFRMLSEKRLSVKALDQAGVIVRVLTPPPPLPEKIWPRVSLVMLPCLLIGLIGGIGLALFADWRWRSPPSHFEPAAAALGEVPAPEALAASAKVGSKR